MLAVNKAATLFFVRTENICYRYRSAPYYAIRGQAFICDAIGGIKINERMEVLDSEDEPIPGLYAAGSTTGCWESESYCYELTGHLLGFALNSGRIAERMQPNSYQLTDKNIHVVKCCFGQSDEPALTEIYL